MIGRHQFQCLAADDPVALERAAVEQHLGEARVIHGGRDQPAAPDSITGLSSMLKSCTLSPLQGSVANGSARRPALASLVWKAVSVICSGARMRSVRNAPSDFPETTS